jgi:hypothetical protein
MFEPTPIWAPQRFCGKHTRIYQGECNDCLRDIELDEDNARNVSKQNKITNGTSF